MTTDTKQLRKLAHAACNKPPIRDVSHSQLYQERLVYMSALEAFIEAIDPTTVLELLDTIDAQRKLLERSLRVFENPSFAATRIELHNDITEYLKGTP